MASAPTASARTSLGINRRDAERRQPWRDFANDGDAARGEIEREDGQTAHRHTHQRSRDFRGHALQHDQEDDQRQAEGEREPVRAPELPAELGKLLDELARLQRDAKELAELTGDDAEPDAVQKAGEDRPRQEISDESEPQDAADDREHANQQRQDH